MLLKTPLRCAAALSFVAYTSAASITSAPTELIGYFRVQAPGDVWSSSTCYGNSFYTSDYYAACCDGPDSDCYVVTSCDPKTLYWNDDTTYSCTGQDTCQIATIFESATTDRPISSIFCYSGREEQTYFRRTPAPATTTSSGLGQTATPGSSITAPPTATATNTDSPKDSEGGGSNAWIAGAVIGPVAGCAIIGALGFWLYRRGMRKGREGTGYGAVVEQFQGPAQQPAPMERFHGLQEKDTDRHLSELPG